MRVRHALVPLILVACSRSNNRPATESDGGQATNSVKSSAGAQSLAMPAVAAAPSAPPMEMKAQRDAPVTDEGAPAGLLQLPARTAAIAASSTSSAMIVRTGQAELTVDSLDAGIARVQALALQVGGWVGNTSIATTGPTRTATLELRVPSARWNDALNGMRGIGKVEQLQVSAEDVGEEFVDVEARKANARRLEERLIQLLATRTGKLSDVVAVEEKLAQVREEIERMEGRSRYLRERASVSTLSLTVHEPLPVVAPKGTPSVLTEATRQAWRNFIG